MSASALRAVLAALVISSAAPAAAYVQTCVGTPPVCLHWPTRSVTWKINTCRPSSSPSCQASGTADPVIDIAKASFQTWQDATRAGDSAPCTDLTFTYGGTTTSIAAGADTGEHLVVFRQGWCSENPDAVKDACYQSSSCGNKFDCFDDEGPLSRNTLALTTVTYKADGTIVDSDTEIVDWDGGAGAIDANVTNGVYVTCYTTGAPAATCTGYGEAGCVSYDLQNTLTHEFGHFIGLAHPCGSGSGGIACTTAMQDYTMYPYEFPAETKKRDLSADDIAGVCAIYPRGVAPAAAVTLSPGAFTPASAQVAAASPASAVCIPSPKSRGGCSSGPGFAGTTLLALLALGVQRRRRPGASSARVSRSPRA